MMKIPTDLTTRRIQFVKNFVKAKPKLNILVYGAGVLGSLYAARLQQAGHNVSILARGERLADLREHGIVLEEAMTGKRTTAAVNVVDDLAPEDAYDLVIVLVRKNQVAAVLPALVANQHTPSVLFMTNNAAGPDEYIRLLGRERVVLGFGSAGGIREGEVIRYFVSVTRLITLGELDGQPSERLARIAGAFKDAGFHVSISNNMEAWLKTHVAMVSPLANAFYMTGSDLTRLTETRDGLVLMIRAVREGFKVLRTLGVPITPPILRTFERTPEPMLVAMLRRGLNTKQAEVALAAHARTARDEMQYLADEFKVLAKAANVPTPAIDRLRMYLDPAAPVMAEGSARLPLDWRSVTAGLETFVGLISVLRLYRGLKGRVAHMRR